MTTTTIMPKLAARVRLHNDTSGRPTKLLAFAELTIGEAFVIKGIRIMQRPGDPADDREPFIVFPAQRGKGDAADRWYDVAHPCTVEAREAATKVILEEHAKVQEAAR